MTDDPALFDVDSVRRLESRARETGGEPLMERAGQAAWRELLDRWPAARRILVACGWGGNGGDGYVLARCAIESGRDAWVVTPTDGAPSNADARLARDRFIAAGGCIEAFDVGLPQADVVVDALLGIGQVGRLDEATSRIVVAITAMGAPVLSLDMPTGIASRVTCPVVSADTTVEFLLPKLVLRTGPAVEHVGSLRLATLGVPRGLQAGLPAAAHAIDASMLARWLAPRGRDSHKGRNGRVLCIGGAPGSGGAILLCAEAALRAGAGLVEVHTDGLHVGPLLARVPEAMASPGEVPRFADADVVAIGPGLGQGDWGRGLFAGALAADRPLVIDADALNLLAQAPRLLPKDSILTPHPGEAARLLGTDVARVQQDRATALARLVERFGCIVVLKGAGTLVGAPGRVACLVDAGNPGLATGGTGDVLTGVIAALRAQGLDAFDAAACGALLHAAAGDVAARAGMRGLRASDLMQPLRELANP